MKTYSLFTTLCVLGLTATQVQAQDVYGTVELSFGNTNLSSDDGAIATAEADGYNILRVNTNLGMVFADRYYVQADLNLGNTTGTDGLDDTYNNSRSYFLHGGALFNNFSAGIFGGIVRTDHETDATATGIRKIIGIEGSYSFLNNRALVYSQIGTINGNGGTDGGDPITDSTFYSLGGSYDFNQGLTLSALIAMSNGHMDTPQNNVDVDMYKLRLDYAIPSVSGLSAFVSATRTELQQSPLATDNDGINDTTISVGLTYAMGKKNLTRRVKSPTYLENWVAITGGVIE